MLKMKRLNTVCELDRCNGCMACIDSCPKTCITIRDTLFAYNAVIDNEKCIQCGKCKKVCPNNGQQITGVYPIKWYQGWAADDIRCSSSSGGAASSIMQAFIMDGGYVASCCFQNGEFIFILTNDLCEAKKFSGSKYVKSNPRGIYKKIAEKLKTDKVLFVGLPCQVAGLLKYCSCNDNLFTVELLCHGTPSPHILEKYLNDRGYPIGSLKAITFRPKKNGNLSENGIRLSTGSALDPYTLSFLEGISHTDNCFNCLYARSERIADLTIGDSWGSELSSEMDKGISLILIQSAKGTQLVENTSIELHDVNLANAIAHNQPLRQKNYEKKNRKKFLKLLEHNVNFQLAVWMCAPYKSLRQIIKIILCRLKLIHNVPSDYGITVYVKK